MISQRGMQTSDEAVATVAIVDGRPGDYAQLLADSPPEVRLEFFTSGREALRAAATQRIDLWIINSKLRDLPGTDLCDLLKARSSDAVLYLVTDQYQSSEERAAWLHGAALYRPKPVQASWLEPVLHRRAAAQVPVQAPSSWSASPADHSPSAVPEPL